MSLTEQFLNALFDDAPCDESKILIWTAPAKLSFYATDVEGALKHVARIGQRQNIYFGCGLVPRSLGQHQRGSIDNIRGIPGLWADIDVLNPVAHNKKRLPPTVDEAIALAESLPLLPTLIVLSGYGIQPWWLFKEPWMFSDADERNSAGSLVHGWQDMLKENAASRGWDHDATHDLARVLRLPGTHNIKDPDNIKDVSVAKWNDARRYNPEDFVSYIEVLGMFKNDISIDDMAEPLFVPRRVTDLPAAFSICLEDDTHLKNTWTRARKGMRDTSHSAFDMSIMGMLAYYGDEFSDQDLADIIFVSRSMHCAEGSKEWKKGLDRQYIARTIKRARAQRAEEVNERKQLEILEKDIPMEEITANAEVVSAITNEPIEDAEVKVAVRTGKPNLTHASKAEKLTALSGILKVKITAIRRYNAEPPQYELILPKGAVTIGDIGRLIGQTEFRKVLAASANVVIPIKKGPAWLSICQSMLDCVDEVEVGEEGTESGIVREWLRQYVYENRPSQDIPGACNVRRPFVDTKEGKEQTYIFLEGLREWLLARQERFKQTELAVMLRRYGCTPLPYNIKFPGQERATTRSVYLLP